MAKTTPVRLMDQVRDYERMGEMIYGFVYMGTTVREKMETAHHA